MTSIVDNPSRCHRNRSGRLLVRFALYQRSSHLKQQISFEDYIRIFETIWQERAGAAGWKLKVDGQGRQIFLRFTK